MFALAQLDLPQLAPTALSTMSHGVPAASTRITLFQLLPVSALSYRFQVKDLLVEIATRIARLMVISDFGIHLWSLIWMVLERRFLPINLKAPSSTARIFATNKAGFILGCGSLLNATAEIASVSGVKAADVVTFATINLVINRQTGAEVCATRMSTSLTRQVALATMAHQ